MNCKQGDLAIIVRSSCGNEGKIVRCMEFAEHVVSRGPGGIPVIYPGWLIDPPVPGLHGGLARYAPDAWLRPIRDTDGEDQVAAIARLKDEEEARRGAALVGWKA